MKPNTTVPVLLPNFIWKASAPVCFSVTMHLFPLILFNVIAFSRSQAPYYPNHWYGANQDNVFTGVVPKNGSEPTKIAGTLAPHVCGFNPVTRQCMDSEHLCRGRCINFAYTYNVRYECRCLVI